MNIGALRHRITLQKPETGTDEYGQPLSGWVGVATVWASIEPLSPTSMSGVKESLAGGAEIAQDMVRVKMRPRADVQASWRFLYKTRPHDIKAARLNNIGDEMTLFATVGANDG